MQDFDNLWNYNKPADTEIKFREVLESSSPEKNLSFHIQLLTQIARTYSLRAMFTEAHELLNEAEKLLPATPETAHVRYHLERGRGFNSAGKKEEASGHFNSAREIAEMLKEDFYAIDAIHMQAIIATPDAAIALNEEAILAAEQSANESAKNWLGSLYNNLGWSYFDKGEFEKALSIFLRALAWRESKQHNVFLAKWCVARTLRAQGKIDEALKIQLALLEEMVTGDEQDGFVYEELGELYLIKNEPLYKMYFGFAYRELSKDTWLAKNESARLERIQQLSV